MRSKQTIYGNITLSKKNGINYDHIKYIKISLIEMCHLQYKKITVLLDQIVK